MFQAMVTGGPESWDQGIRVAIFSAIGFIRSIGTMSARFFAVISIVPVCPFFTAEQVVLKPIASFPAGGMLVEQVMGPKLFTST